MTVVAEGVETEEQLRRLTALGCTSAAGHLLCPPLDEDGLLDQFALLTGRTF
ncbi:MAG: hypothetical protein ACKO04_06800 [Actinomycetes bacterium]